jgi:glyoxylase-like metal-dependent hydrolase (beta-lactamase superfamily II)
VIPFVRDDALAYGRPDQVSPLIRRVVAPNPGPFTFTGTATYIIGRGEVAVIDPGPAETAAPGHLAALLDALKGDRVAHILVTHSHLDHSPLAARLQEATGAPILGRAAAAAHLPFAPTEEVDQLAFIPDRELAGDERLAGPGWTLSTVPTPGHASNHLCFVLTEENALLCGDHVMGWSTTVVSPPDGDMGDYLASLDRVIAGDFATLWPAHGPPVTDPAPFLRAYREHRLEREAQILAGLRGGAARIRTLVETLYAGVDARLWPAAAQSVWAHLIHLHETGRVEAEGGPGLDSAYAVRDGR